MWRKASLGEIQELHCPQQGGRLQKKGTTQYGMDIWVEALCPERQSEWSVLRLLMCWHHSCTLTQI